MGDSTKQQKDNKDAESGEPIQLDDKKQPQQGQRKPEQHEPGNEAGGMEQGAPRPQHEGGHKK